jgi:hypothetical protein
MTYEITINPCKACTKKYERECCGINSMNNCVNETAAAFAGYPGIYAISSQASCSNDECIANIRNKMGPFPGWYKNRKLAKAPVFIQEPHYLPGLLSKGHSLEEAKNICITMCNSEECIQNCITDSDAVESIRPSTNTCNLAPSIPPINNYVQVEEYIPVTQPVIATIPFDTSPPPKPPQIPINYQIKENLNDIPSGASCSSKPNNLLLIIGIISALMFLLFLLKGNY